MTLSILRPTALAQFALFSSATLLRAVHQSKGSDAMPSGKAKDIPTQIKDKVLVARRRRQIVDAAVGLFLEHGFHKTTTRQIARAAGISIGLLYEYIASKEDVLYMVCDAIHTEMHAAVTEAVAQTRFDGHPLAAVIRDYFLVCHRWSDHIVLIYQEIHSLPPNWRNIVLQNEMRITGLFSKLFADMIQAGRLFPMDDRRLDLAAHNISVLGQMWAFRRWMLSRWYTIDEYIEIQTDFIMRRLNRENDRRPA
jgi:AcrR family transcriptional regulator